MVYLLELVVLALLSSIDLELIQRHGISVRPCGTWSFLRTDGFFPTWARGFALLSTPPRRKTVQHSRPQPSSRHRWVWKWGVGWWVGRGWGVGEGGWGVGGGGVATDVPALKN